MTGRAALRLATPSLRVGVGVAMVALAAGSLIGGGAPLVGQTLAPRDSIQAALADRLRGQPRARVQLRDGSEVELLDPSLDGDSLRFTAFASVRPRSDTLLGPEARSLALADVMRVQVRKTAAAKGAIFGVILGGTALALRDRTGDPPTWDHNETLFFGMIGGVLGGVLGGVIGAPFRAWTTVYQALPAWPSCRVPNPPPSASAQQGSDTKALRIRTARCVHVRALG